MLIASWVSADVVFTNDGREIVGEAVQNGDTITVTTASGDAIELHEDNVIYIIRRDEDSTGDIATVRPNSPDVEPRDNANVAQTANTGGDTDDNTETSYFVIPIRGIIGEEMIVRTLEMSFNVASARGADVVVLHIDSGGGRVETKHEILDLLREEREEFRIVAYVDDAQSAAAIIALACTDIIMAPGASMGSCVPYRIAPDGTPANVEAKFAAIEMASIRAIAEEAGHSPLLAQAMMDDEIVISYALGTDGEVQIFEGVSSGTPREESEEDRLVLQRLGRRDTFGFDNVDLETVLNYFQNTYGLNVYVDWNELELADVTRTTPVEVRLSNVTVGAALETVLRYVDLSGNPLDYYIDQGIVHITTQRIAASRTYTNSTIIKEEGEILNLTANEATMYGLAVGVADSVEDIGALLGLSAWDEVGAGRGNHIQSEWEEEYEQFCDFRRGAWDDFYQLWDDLIEACEDGDQPRAVRIIGEARREMRTLQVQLARYEDDLPEITDWDLELVEGNVRALNHIQEDIRAWDP